MDTIIVGDVCYCGWGIRGSRTGSRTYDMENRGERPRCLDYFSICWVRIDHCLRTIENKIFFFSQSDRNCVWTTILSHLSDKVFKIFNCSLKKGVPVDPFLVPASTLQLVVVVTILSVEWFILKNTLVTHKNDGIAYLLSLSDVTVNEMCWMCP